MQKENNVKTKIKVN